jgi:glutathione S-transferase
VTETTQPAAPLSLLTFGPMIDCELSRFVLAHYRIPYREEPHIFAWSSVLAVVHGGYGRVPILYGRGLCLSGPRAIVDHYEPGCAVDLRLIPAGQPWRTQVEADWDLYNGQLAADTAALAYYYLLPHRDIMLEPFTRGIPAWETSITPTIYPFLRSLFTLLLRLSPGKAADALARVRLVFDKTDARIADGRPYLVGDGLTLGDLALATATAPLLLPDGYTAPIPPFDVMPPELQAIIRELRQRPTADFVRRIYGLRTRPSAVSL